jgi:hypothetical protein
VGARGCSPGPREGASSRRVGRASAPAGRGEAGRGPTRPRRLRCGRGGRVGGHRCGRGGSVSGYWRRENGRAGRTLGVHGPTLCRLVTCEVTDADLKCARAGETCRIDGPELDGHRARAAEALTWALIVLDQGPSMLSSMKEMPVRVSLTSRPRSYEPGDTVVSRASQSAPRSERVGGSARGPTRSRSAPGESGTIGHPSSRGERRS